MTGKFINFGNFSSFPASILKKIISKDEIYLAYSSGVINNYKKIFLYAVNKNKRFYGDSKVNFSFLFLHSMKIISVFLNIVFLRSFLISILLVITSSNPIIDLIIIILFLSFSSFLLILNWFGKPKRKFNLYIKNILHVQ